MLGPARASSLLIAKSVEQTLQIARAVSIGCIILDDGAPSFTSYDVAQEIRRGLSWPQKAVPLIVVTVKPTLTTIRKVIAAGIDEILSAPVTREAFDARMLAIARRDRPLVTADSYQGPCRRRGRYMSQLAGQRRRATDNRAARPVVNRQTQAYSELYHSTRVAIDLLSPSMLALERAHIQRAIRRLHQRAAAVNDERIRCLSRLAVEAAESVDRNDREVVKLAITLRDMLLLINDRLGPKQSESPDRPLTNAVMV